MVMSNSFRERAERFIDRPSDPNELAMLVRDCVLDRGLEALTSVCRLYEDMYGGITFNSELKGPAAAALLAWEKNGLLALVEGARRTPTGKNSGLAMQILAMAASGDASNRFFRCDPIVDEIVDCAASIPSLQELAGSLLVELILSFDDDDDVASSVGLTLMGFSFSQSAAAKQLINAVSRRWMAMSTPVLDEFDALIKAQPSHEPAFQEFLTKHPQILDPLAHEVWPTPDLFGFREPDFLVKRADGTYMVVEIECPGKPLVTGGGQLAAGVTHAEQQVMDYRRNLIRKFPDMRLHIPDFQEPDCLVVVGLERDLIDHQRQVLRDANHSRNHLSIVGFDWLLERGRKISANVVQHGVKVSKLRVV